LLQKGEHAVVRLHQRIVGDHVFQQGEEQAACGQQQHCPDQHGLPPGTGRLQDPKRHPRDTAIVLPQHGQQASAAARRPGRDAPVHAGDQPDGQPEHKREQHQQQREPAADGFCHLQG
jgi:hypothetical protein